MRSSHRTKIIISLFIVLVVGLTFASNLLDSTSVIDKSSKQNPNIAKKAEQKAVQTLPKEKLADSKSKASSLGTKPPTVKKINYKFLTKSSVFSSFHQEGLIGVTKDKPVDSPSDNVFHIAVNNKLRGNEKVWLEYDLLGVADYTGISHSINDQLAVGGYLVKQNDTWSHQKEQLNPKDLKAGMNTIRFSLPEEASYNYQVKNVRLHIEPIKEGTLPSLQVDKQLVINQPTSEYHYGNLAYIQGYVLGGKAKISIEGQDVRYNNGTFESIVKNENVQHTDWIVTVKATFEDGQILESNVKFTQALTSDIVYPFNKDIYCTEQFAALNKGFDIQLSKAHLTGEAGALDKSTKISITGLRDRDIPSLDADMVNVTAGFSAYRFLPHGTQFKKNIDVQIAYDTTKIPDGYGANDIQTFFFNEKTNHWVALPKDSVLLASQTIHSLSNHFSDYINAIIKVPESPQTQGYTPTSIKDIKAANPTLAVNMIAPPQANNMGNANLSYPLNIPAGRQGLQPQLALSYNSGGGNGWCGLGWDLSFQSISVETRWGVPHYSNSKESETYVLSGQQLSPVAHRSEWEPRSTENEKQFYPRIEGSFQKIMRYGKFPSTYRWVVTDKSGVKYYYGGVNSVEETAVLRRKQTDGEANAPIAKWALVKIEDLNGNFVRYHYKTKTYTGSGCVNSHGYQTYLDYITYTGFNNVEGKYSVHFTREENVRPDVSITANYGFKQVEADLLTKIEVKFENSLIRRYELKYKTGAFFKTLLDSIKEYDANGHFFTAHGFEYYNDVQNNAGKYIPFKNTVENWDTKEDDIKGGFISSYLGILNDKASAISGTKSLDWGVGISANVGWGPEAYLKNLSVGGSYDFSKSTSNSQLSLVDINGDGLVDKVMVKDDKIEYRLQYKDANGQSLYKDNIESIVLDNGIELDQFLETVGKNNTVGLTVYFKAASIGASYGWGRSITSTYFSDVNGDGLIDIVKDKKVYFNYLNDDGEIHFSSTSDSTEVPIQAGAIAGGLTGADINEVIKAKQDNPLHDVVRMWRAPISGLIRINAPVRLIEDYSEEREDYPADGVRVAIQVRGDEKWSTPISADDYSIKIPTGLNNIYVNEGDQVYFRVQSIDNGAYDQVHWDPEITYFTEDTTLLDANGQYFFKYKAADDYLLASTTGAVYAPIKGRIRIKCPLFIPPTSDNSRAVIYRNGTPIKTINVAWNQGINTVIDSIIPVDSNDVFTFRIESSTNIAWTKIKWNPYFYYTHSDDSHISDDQLFDPEGRPTIYSRIVPQMRLYPYVSEIPEVWTKEDPTNNSIKLTIKPSFKVSSSVKSLFNSGELRSPLNLSFSVKKRNTLLYEDIITFTYDYINQELIYNEPDSVTLTVLETDSLYLEYHTDSLSFLNKLKNFKDSVVYYEYIYETIDCSNPDGLDANKIDTLIVDDDTTCVFIDTVRHASFIKTGRYASTPGKEQIFGHMYRNWGQFAYNANDGREDQPIDEDELNMKDAETSNDNLEDSEGDFEDIDNADDFESTANDKEACNTQKKIFVYLMPNAHRVAFTGLDPLTYISRDTISASRKGEDRIELFDPMEGTSGTGATAVDKITKSSSLSFHANIKNAGGSYSKSKNKLITDFIDMNGDRFPDIVTDKKIQYTSPLGDLKTDNDFIYNHSEDINNLSSSYTIGASYGGKAPLASSEDKNNPKSSKVTLKGNYSVGGNYSNSETQYTWRDINGDGLPDRINQNDNTVKINLGYALAPAEPWDNITINSSESISINAGVGLAKEVNIEEGSIVFGVGLGGSRNILRKGMQDVNGDGLPDIIEVDNSILTDLINDVDVYIHSDTRNVKVRLNLGNTFSEPITWNGAIYTSKSKSSNESANVAFTFGFTFGFGKLTFTPSANISQSYNRENLTLSDVDGDGFPDYLESEEDKQLQVKRSTIARTNKLKAVHRPLGANFSMDYKPIGNTYKMPQTVWALNTVKVFDGHIGDGEDTSRVRFSYEDGYKDRYERDFYGFKKVTTEQLDKNGAVYRYTVKNFENTNYYTKGALLSEATYSGDGKKYAESISTYEVEDINGDIKFPKLVKKESKLFEGTTDQDKGTYTSFEYGDYGNVVRYVDAGDLNNSNDDLTAIITYHQEADLMDKNIVSVPATIKVLSNRTLLRERKAEVDLQTGKITKIIQMADNGQAVTDIHYDAYGSLDSIVYPKNYRNQRMYYGYTYDNTVHQFVTQVRDAFGYSSSSTYDYKFGALLSSIDLNGQPMRYTIDAKGRITTITGPYEIEKGLPFTIKFDYFINDPVPWARTQHYDPEHEDNYIETALFVDGLTKVLQTKKDIAIYTGEGQADADKRVVSGKVIYDEFGRALTSYYPVLDSKSELGEFETAVDNIDPTTKTYDVMDRPLLTRLPDGSEMRMEYGFGYDRDGLLQFRTAMTDANNNTVESFTDMRKQKTATKAPYDTWTSFVYNAVGELVAAKDAEDNVTTYSYDRLGRLLNRNHPDAGLTEYTYDIAGNMIKSVTANLREENKAIRYEYDYSRPSKILYPDNEENNVSYTYGAPNADFNRAGRLVKQEDASGTQEFYYGKLGEIVKNKRIIVAPACLLYSFTTEWQYDTWNRLKTITYPDGEKVTYHYNTGGTLHSVEGVKGNYTYPYLTQLSYDKFESRLFISYGNGTKTHYNYESDTRHLKHMVAYTSSDRKMINNTYTYDAVGNILKLENAAPIPTGDGFMGGGGPMGGGSMGDISAHMSELMGGKATYTYQYDNLYRLVHSEGSYSGFLQSDRYTMDMSYSPTGNILEKNQHHETKKMMMFRWQEKRKTTYDNNYEYNGDKPHAPSKIGDKTYRYDANGNVVERKKLPFKRRIIWDEENRMQAISDNMQSFHYIYDASGERVIKGMGMGQTIYINGFPMGTHSSIGAYTVYVSPFVVIRNFRMSKHFYMEGQRISTKLAKMRPDEYLLNPMDTSSLPSGSTWQAKQSAMEALLGRNIDSLMGNTNPTDSLSQPQGHLQSFFSGTDAPFSVGTANMPAIMDTLEKENSQYFYHSDHLGSTSYITNVNGDISQHIEYFPFGETFMEEHNATDEYSHYKFNGKELDEETGLYYYGARYYDPQISMWYGVDPMADKYPNVSAFMYTMGNPVMLIDPDGNSVDWIQNEETGGYEWNDNVTKASETPKGYSYVGPNDEDILTNLNLPNEFPIKNDSRTSFGLDGDNRSGAPVGTNANITGNISVKADVVNDKNNVSSSNVNGKTFKGVTFKANFSQSSKSGNSDLKMNYKGYFAVQYGDKTYTNTLTKPTGSYFYETGTNPLQAKVSISSSNISNLKIFRNAFISAGVTNNSLFVSPKPIKLQWNLMRNSVLLPKE